MELTLDIFDQQVHSLIVSSIPIPSFSSASCQSHFSQRFFEQNLPTSRRHKDIHVSTGNTVHSQRKPHLFLPLEPSRNHLQRVAQGACQRGDVFEDDDVRDIGSQVRADVDPQRAHQAEVESMNPPRHPVNCRPLLQPMVLLKTNTSDIFKPHEPKSNGIEETCCLLLNYPHGFHKSCQMVKKKRPKNHGFDSCFFLIQKNTPCNLTCMIGHTKNH